MTFRAHALLRSALLLGLAVVSPGLAVAQSGGGAKVGLSRVLQGAAIRSRVSAASVPQPPAEPPSDATEDEEPAGLPAALLEEIEQLAASELTPAEARAAARRLFDAAAGSKDGVDLLKDRLRELSRGRRDAVSARRMLGWIAWRYGDLKDASRAFERLAEDAGDLESRLAHAQLLDARGETDEALEAYGELLPDVAEAEQRTRLRLRMALMSMETGGDAQKDALGAFAREPDVAPELRNRCAIVLALLGRPGEAAALYQVPDLAPDGATTDVVKRARKAAANGELRVAEWSIDAEDWPRAQDAAWRAVRLATVARERRYGLTLLAEAHRGDGSLDGLLARFDAERDALSPEARRMWIELLRETGKTDEAIAMTQGAGAGSFSREDRIRLLEMYREAGRVDQMIQVYGEWIAAEPAELSWRKGLSRHHLENGDRERAIGVWEAWLDATAEIGADDAALLEAAEMLRGLGLDDLALAAAERVVDGGGQVEAALLFEFELALERGRIDGAREQLDRLDGLADAGSPARMPLSDGYERIGELESAVRTLEGVRAARPEGRAGEDLEMRLAWLYSEVGREEQALELWRELWLRVKSVARRRFVEDRMMTVAARLGVLADIAVDLERKLVGGEATDRDSGLLVRLYSKVGDAVSAAEIIDEFLSLTGGSELEALTEKARVYLACNDFFHYEEAVARLIELDPDGRPDYFRQLAMSQLERGRPDEARETLMRLQELPGGDDTSAEFEAGVLSLSGLREEAIAAYRRGLVAHPERIDSYLLMAGLMKQVRQSDRAVGMFQFLAETAPKDDVFTIAVDGLLNMLVDAPPRPEMVQWARRITLERLASREDAAYLYQLLADLAEETGDDRGQVVALQSLLASAGPRRASVLRELMELSKPQRASFNVKGREGDEAQRLAFGRRLVGLGELVPPEVFLDLGDAFLEAGDERAAARTFDLTREFPDGDLYQKSSAERFEQAGYVQRALERYQAVLAASPSDVALLTKVAELREALGDDAAALELYARAHGILLSRRLLLENKKKEEEKKGFFMPRNVDELDRYGERVLGGLLATMDEAQLDGFLEDQLAAVEREIPQAFAAADADRGEGADAPVARRLDQHPRLGSRAELVRRVAFATGRLEAAERLDRVLLEAFPEDEALVNAALRERARWGLISMAAPAPSRPEAAGRIPFDQAVASALPAVAAGDRERLRSTLSRADLGRVADEELSGMGVLFSAARAARDEELALRVGRDWLRLMLADSPNPYEIERLLDVILPGLGEETGLALARYLVGLIVEDPEANARLVNLLPKLASEFGEAAVSAEQVQLLVDGFGEAYAFGLLPVLLLLPEEDRASSLRTIWSKLEAQGRSRFLLGMINESPSELPDAIATFIRESLPAALDDGTDLLEYYVNLLLEVPHSHELVLDVCELLLERGVEAETMGAAIVIHRAALEGAEALLAEGAAAFTALASQEDLDYRTEKAMEQLAGAFGEDLRSAFLAAVAEEAGASDTARPLDFVLAELLAEWDLHAEALALLEPLDAEGEAERTRLELMLRAQRALGRDLAAARTVSRRAKVAEDDDDRKRYLRQAVRAWEQLGAFEVALEAQRALDELGAGRKAAGPALPPGVVLGPGTVSLSVGGVTYFPSGEGPEMEKGLPKTFKDVREALGEGRTEDAVRIFRRLWRDFPVGEPDSRFPGSFSFRGLPLASLRWPSPPRDGDDDEHAEERRSGGLAAFLAPPLPERPPAPDAYEKLAAHPEIVAEERRYLRSVRPQELDRLQALLRGLVQVEASERGVDVLLDELLEEVRGAGGRLAQIELLTLLDLHPELVTEEAAAALADLARTTPPLDAAQVLRLARTLLRSGQRDEALRLYEWCALASPMGEVVRFGVENNYVMTSVPLVELLEDLSENLEEEERVGPVEALLQAATAGTRPWDVEVIRSLKVRTWADLVPPAEALERLGDLTDDALDLSEGLYRSVALELAPLLAAAGDLERARWALEVGVARLEDLEIGGDDSFWMDDPSQPASIPSRVLGDLLPAEGEGLADPAAWYRTLASAYSEWLAANRVEPSDAVQVLSLCALRMGELGLEEEGRALAAELLQLDGVDARSRLWIADALRALGEETAASGVEEELLAAEALKVARIPRVIEGLLEREGAAAALEVGARAAELSHPQALLEVLVRAATEAGDEGAAAEWRRTAEVAAQAADELKALKARAAKEK